MRKALTSGICIFLFFPLYSQRNVDMADLLIECYELLYAPETLAEVSTPDVVAEFTCMQPPENFYDNFFDFRIGFDIQQQIREVFKFSFRDSVAPPLSIPLKITSGFGIFRGAGRYHQGLDFDLSIGDTVYSVFCGEVRIETVDPGGYGNVVVVRNYNLSETLYGHLDKSLVKNGQKVTVGEPIGIGGNTGVSTGPHLHFEIRSEGYSFNPIVNDKFLDKHEVSR